MKKMFLNMGCTLLAAMMLTNCNNDETTFENIIPEPQNGNLSFVLPVGKKNSTTYATITGLDSEYQISNLFIYWFKQDALGSYGLYKVFKYGTASGNSITLSNELTAANNSTMATISVGEDHTPSRFYFVANMNIAGSSINSTDLAGLQVGATTTAFETIVAKLSDNNETGTKKILDNISTPLPMSVNKNQSGLNGGYVNVADPAAGGIVTTQIHLKRRVARFDIINNMDYSNFEVKNVYISRAKQHGFIQDFNTISGLLDYGNQIVNVQSANGTRGNNADANNDGIADDFQGANPLRDSLELNPAQFYIWPTELKANNVSDPTDGTEIVVEGIFNAGVTRLYKLNLTADQSIEANKVYRIMIGRVTENQLKFNLVVDHWDGADTLSTVPTDNTIDWANCSFDVKTAGNPATFSNLSVATQRYDYTSRDTINIEIEVKGKTLTGGAGKHAASVEILPNDSINNLPSDLTSTLQQSNITAKTTIETTTSGSIYKTVFTIKLPPTDAPLSTTLSIVNPADDSDFRTVNLYSFNYNKSGIRPYNNPSISVYWAPLNVGATQECTISTSLTNPTTFEDIIGKRFQWGRNDGWYGNVDAANRVPGPITAAQIAANAGKFIEVAAGSWLTPWTVDLWSGIANIQGPCPSGWRLPSESDFVNFKIAARRSIAGNLYDNDAQGGLCCLPASGLCKNGVVSNTGTEGNYWGYQSESGGSCNNLHFSQTVINPTMSDNSKAFSVRCVRDKQ